MDGNQQAIVKALRKIPGVSVACTHQVSKGFPDIVVGYKGANYMFELKDGKLPPSARKLTFEEVMFHRTWCGAVCVVTSLNEALIAIGIKK